jgi:hypothetical protein
MNWGDEGYVRIYRRNTADLIAMGWEARALLWELLRHADRSGVLEFGKHGLRGLARLIDLPIEVVERNLPVLVDDGCVRTTERGIVIPNYQPAQEASRSDRVRKAEERARKREIALASTAPTPNTAPSMRHESVTPGHENVTPGHEESRAVTPSHERSRNVTQCQISVPDLSARPQRAQAREAGGPEHGPEREAKVEATVGGSVRRFELGASAERAVEVYGDALAEALGHRVAIPSERSVRQALCDALNVHGRPESLSDGLAWLRAATIGWVREVPEDKRAFTGGWAPKRFVAWLNERGGYHLRPSARAPEPASAAEVLDGDPLTAEELADLEAKLATFGTTVIPEPSTTSKSSPTDPDADAKARSWEASRAAAIASLRLADADCQRQAGSSNAFRVPDGSSVRPATKTRPGAVQGEAQVSPMLGPEASL